MSSDLKLLSRFLDSQYRGPFGFRFGWDGLLGLIPGVGNLITNLLSLYIILRSAMLGAPVSLVLRMFLNLFIENFVGLIPIIGNVFDFIWKANEKNLKLLSDYELKPGPAKLKAMLIVGCIIFLGLALIVGLVWLSVVIFQLSYQYTQAFMASY